MTNAIIMNDGTITLNGSIYTADSLDNSGALYVNRSTVVKRSFANYGNVVSVEGITVSGALTNAKTAELLSNGSVVVEGSLENDGSLLSGSLIDVGGALMNRGDIGTASLHVSGGQINVGTIRIVSSVSVPEMPTGDPLIDDDTQWEFQCEATRERAEFDADSFLSLVSLFPLGL